MLWNGRSAREKAERVGAGGLGVEEAAGSEADTGTERAKLFPESSQTAGYPAVRTAG